jgi:hypothetical protein
LETCETNQIVSEACWGAGLEKVVTKKQGIAAVIEQIREERLVYIFNCESCDIVINF